MRAAGCARQARAARFPFTCGCAPGHDAAAARHGCALPGATHAAAPRWQRICLHNSPARGAMARGGAPPRAGGGGRRATVAARQPRVSFMRALPWEAEARSEALRAPAAAQDRATAPSRRAPGRADPPRRCRGGCTPERPSLHPCTSLALAPPPRCTRRPARRAAQAPPTHTPLPPRTTPRTMVQAESQRRATTAKHPRVLAQKASARRPPYL